MDLLVLAGLAAAYTAVAASVLQILPDTKYRRVNNYAVSYKTVCRACKLECYDARYTQVVDAFTTKQFCGNQAAVVLLKDGISADIMQNIASENNLSETAFIVCNDSGIYEIRWFSPLKEINFCGHWLRAPACRRI